MAGKVQMSRLQKNQGKISEDATPPGSIDDVYSEDPDYYYEQYQGEEKPPLDNFYSERSDYYA